MQCSLFPGVMLKWNKFGNHLDASGNTIDVKLEKKNFYAQAHVLAEIWTQLVINGYPVMCHVLEKGHELKVRKSQKVFLNLAPSSRKLIQISNPKVFTLGCNI